MFDSLLKLWETFSTAQEDKGQITKTKDKVQRQNTNSKYKDKVQTRNLPFSHVRLAAQTQRDFFSLPAIVSAHLSQDPANVLWKICLRILRTFYERFNQHFWDLDQKSGKIKRDLFNLLEQHLKGWFLWSKTNCIKSLINSGLSYIKAYMIKMNWPKHGNQNSKIRIQLRCYPVKQCRLHFIENLFVHNFLVVTPHLNCDMSSKLVDNIFQGWLQYDMFKLLCIHMHTIKYSTAWSRLK